MSDVEDKSVEEAAPQEQHPGDAASETKEAERSGNICTRCISFLCRPCTNLFSAFCGANWAAWCGDDRSNNSILREWRLGMFSAVDINGRTLDIAATFMPRPRVVTCIPKVAFLAFILYYMIDDAVNRSYPKFYLAFFVQWANLAIVLYDILSLARMLCPPRQDPVDFLTRALWASFAMALNVNVISTIFFWSFVYDGDFNIVKVFRNGIWLALLYFDGFVVNRTPLRFKQCVWVYLPMIGYGVWLIVQGLLDIGNPHMSDSDPDTDDDALYNVLNWNERPGLAGGIYAFVLFVMIPLSFLGNWVMGNLLPHRYLPVDYDAGEAVGKDVEGGEDDDEEEYDADAKDDDENEGGDDDDAGGDDFENYDIDDDTDAMSA